MKCNHRLNDNHGLIETWSAVEDLVEQLHEKVDAVYRAEARRVLVTLISKLRDFDLAEEALHDAFRAALEQWPRDEVPVNPRAWLISVGRFKAIDRIRRRTRFDLLNEASTPDIANDQDDSVGEDESVRDAGVWGYGTARRKPAI